MRKGAGFFSRSAEHLFSLKKNKTDFSQEVLAGVTTFASMAYIIAVNPQILSRTGMDFGAVIFATILASFVGTLIVGWLSNYPFAVAPGMGLNAYFAYGIIQEGFTWQQALGACFLAGCLLYLLNILGIRELIVNSVPKNLRLATIGGIGILIAFIGFIQVELIIHDAETLVTIGNTHRVEVLLFLFGLLLITILHILGFRFALLVGIATNWLIGFAFGLVPWKGLMSLPPDPMPTLFALELSGLSTPSFYAVVLSIVFVSLFDATGTLLSLGKHAGYLTQEGHLPRVRQAMFGDTLGTIVGSLFGSSPATTYLESSTGIAAGGRTGLTNVIVALLFAISLFLTPLIASIPLFATAPVLVFIGIILTQQLQEMDWEDMTEWAPSFFILIGIPLTFSIAMGMALGFVAFPLIKLCTGRAKDVSGLIWTLAFVFSLRLFF